AAGDEAGAEGALADSGPDGGRLAVCRATGADTTATATTTAAADAPAPVKPRRRCCRRRTARARIAACGGATGRMREVASCRPRATSSGLRSVMCVSHQDAELGESAGAIALHAADRDAKDLSNLRLRE